MKNELAQLCEDLESHFDHRLEQYDERLLRLEKEINTRLDHLTGRYPDDEDVQELNQLNIGLRRTHRLLRGKVEAIREDGDSLLDELGKEIKQRAPSMRKKIEESQSYEQAAREIQREMHTSTQSFKDFMKGLLMWKDTPEERLEQKTNKH